MGQLCPLIVPRLAPVAPHYWPTTLINARSLVNSVDCQSRFKLIELRLIRLKSIVPALLVAISGSNVSLDPRDLIRESRIEQLGNSDGYHL